MTKPDRVGLYIDPPSHHFEEDRLFQSSMARYGGDDLMAPHRAVRDHFRSAGVPVHTADRLPPEPDGRINVVVALGMRGGVEDYRRLADRPDTVLSAYIPLECPIVDPDLYARLPEMKEVFRRVFSWGTPEGLRPFVGQRVETEEFHWPQSFDDIHEDLWRREDRGFLMMMNSNKDPVIRTAELYTERLRAVEHFERFDEIDLYGRHWGGKPIKVGKFLLPWTLRRPLLALQKMAWRARQAIRPDPLYSAAARANRGPAESKSEVLSRYRFAICFENMVLPGWITEKIFDCFFTGTVPIYLGAPEIAEKIPSDCFIDMRDFNGYGELRAYLHALSPDEIRGFREAARDFLRSARFDPFHKSTFVDIFRRVVREDVGLEV